MGDSVPLPIEFVDGQVDEGALLDAVRSARATFKAHMRVQGVSEAHPALTLTDLERQQVQDAYKQLKALTRDDQTPEKRAEACAWLAGQLPKSVEALKGRMLPLRLDAAQVEFSQADEGAALFKGDFEAHGGNCEEPAPFKLDSVLGVTVHTPMFARRMAKAQMEQELAQSAAYMVDERAAGPSNIKAPAPAIAAPKATIVGSANEEHKEGEGGTKASGQAGAMVPPEPSRAGGGEKRRRAGSEGAQRASDSAVAELPPGLFIVETIVARTKVGKDWKYLVKWAGYPSTQSSWEPTRNVKALAEYARFMHAPVNWVSMEDHSPVA